MTRLGAPGYAMGVIEAPATAATTPTVRPWQDWVGLLARLILGVTLLVAGLLKVGNLGKSVLAVRAFQILPYDLTATVGYLLPVFEIIVGVLLVLGLFTRISALAGALLMVAFIIGIVSAWSRGLSLDCGCFGGGGTIAPEDTRYGWDIIRDLGLAACGAWLVWRPRSVAALDTWLFRPISVSSDLDDQEPSA